MILRFQEAAAAAEAEVEAWSAHFGNGGPLQPRPGDSAFYYDEWDYRINDYRPRWCRVVERECMKGAAGYVPQVRAQYAGVLSSVRHQFQMLRPTGLRRVSGQVDGDELDWSAVVDYLIDRRTIPSPHDRLYTQRLRRERDVAVCFLLDMSSSTSHTVGGSGKRRIIEIEKEALVLMCEALEAVGDIYAIYGFSSHGRARVTFYLVKAFDAAYSVEVNQRIAGIRYLVNTRLGAAIRHATARLAAQPHATRLLILLSDGRPYDEDYGDQQYAREDTHVALREAKMHGVTPFCITVDSRAESELREIYGEVGYTIVDDVLSLPERMVGIYRRLTT
jgi:nitric oxide reductase activation protein